MAGFEVPESIVSALESRNKLLFIDSEVDYKIPVTHWESFLFDAHKLQNGIYYSVCPGHINVSVLQWSQVCPLITN